jgi:DNA-directed RNA polymerase subunit RPC12/RpoP
MRERETIYMECPRCGERKLMQEGPGRTVVYQGEHLPGTCQEVER